MCNLAALFDLDGVVIDTENQYTDFWCEIGKEYFPENPNFKHDIKGSTLFDIYNKYFIGQIETQNVITKKLNIFQNQMKYNYIDGIIDFLKDLRSNGVKIAIVTSSNDEKMKNVHSSHPEFKSFIDVFITANKVKHSKPDPECYLTAAKELGVSYENCIVFEDSFLGLQAGRNAKMTVVGLATTNSAEDIKDKCDCVLKDFTDFSFDKLISIEKK